MVFGVLANALAEGLTVVHAPHYRAAPPGWKRSQRGRLYRTESDGRRVVLLSPEKRRGWRAAVYAAGATRARIVELPGVLTEHVAARRAVETLRLEATTGDAPWIHRHRARPAARPAAGPAAVGPPRP